MTQWVCWVEEDPAAPFSFPLSFLFDRKSEVFFPSTLRPRVSATLR